MNKSRNNIKFSNLFIVLAFFCFVFIIYRVSFLATATEIDNRNIKEFATDRSVFEATIEAKRGNIFDINGEALAQNVSSYNLIAYLDPKRSENEDKLYHVKDKKNTAKKLATVINMKEEDILEILNQEGLYQVEFGNAGRNLTEMKKEAIVALNLPGISFIESQKRYYPNGDFASYIIGYAKKDENQKITGELGLELLLDEQLSGTNGFTKYQMDVNGYKIAGTKEYTKEAQNGNNIYLTIDSNIQFFVEQAITACEKKYKYDWLTIVLADAKTGAILASAQSPSFDPNILDIENYLDLTVAQPYEPGSIMKIYTYMAAMEAGTYDGNKKFKSGSYVTEDKTVVSDWNKYGWGNITYDQGFLASSNVGVINIVNNFINRKILLDYFAKMGFGEKTGITLANEQAGKVSFTYQTEVYNAAFGQGILTTPIQHIQALTSLSNDGIMLQPYIIDKVTDSKGNIIYQGKKNELKTVASHETVEHIKDLMYDTVHSKWVPATGDMYYIKGYDVIGKTGTSQLVNPTTGKYYTNDYNSIRSVVGMWPKNDPQVIFYISVKKSVSGSGPLSTAAKSIIQNVSKYLNIFKTNEKESLKNYEVKNYINNNTDTIEKSLNDNKVKYIKLGNGNKIINQYPEKGYILNGNENIILLTNDISYKLPNLTKYSKKEVRAICNLLSLNCKYEGYGYAIKQSISANTIIKKDQLLNVTFKEIY